MAEAVIFDDGGSTRIKRVMTGTAVGAMDSLLDVDDRGDGTRGSEHTISDSYTKLRIVTQDKTGRAFEITDTSFATVEISSGLDQEIIAAKTTTSLTLTVFSGTGEPIVESKQHKKKRRYVVSNSGPIEKITVDGTIVFNIRQGETTVLPTGAAKPIFYTSVVLT